MKSFFQEVKGVYDDVEKAYREAPKEIAGYVVDNLPEQLRLSATKEQESEEEEEFKFPDETKLEAFQFKQILTEPVLPGFYYLTDSIIVCPPLFGVE